MSKIVILFIGLLGLFLLIPGRVNAAPGCNCSLECNNVPSTCNGRCCTEDSRGRVTCRSCQVACTRQVCNCPSNCGSLSTNCAAHGQYGCQDKYGNSTCCDFGPTPPPAPSCDANAWGGWSACSATCGPGTQTRTNACGTPQTQSCQINDPNVWGGWGICSTSCGGGYQTRVNQCGTSQSQACNTQACTWWQVKDADVSTNSDLRSMIPVGNYFGLIGAGGYPGIPAYAGGTNLTPANVSANGWAVIQLSI